MPLPRETLVEYSLFFRMKDEILLQGRFVQEITGDVLTQDAGDPTLWISTRGRWVYADPATYPFTIYDNGVPVSPADFTLFPLGARVRPDDTIFDLPGPGAIRFIPPFVPVGPVTADYFKDLVMCVNDFPEELDNRILPVMSVVAENKTERGLCLGQGKFISRAYTIDIWGRNRVERDALSDIVSEATDVPLPLYNFDGLGFPLMEDGSVNVGFTYETDRRLSFESESLFATKVREPIPERRFRARVTFRVQDDRKLVP